MTSVNLIIIRDINKRKDQVAFSKLTISVYGIQIYGSQTILISTTFSKSTISVMISQMEV